MKLIICAAAITLALAPAALARGGSGYATGGHAARGYDGGAVTGRRGIWMVPRGAHFWPPGPPLPQAQPLIYYKQIIGE